MTDERLAEIRANLPDPSADLSMRERNAHALLAEVERLREGIEALDENWRREWCNERDSRAQTFDMDTITAFRDDLQTLLNPEATA